MTWKCCKNEPPETGKKVLCHRKGDLYVALRIYDLYLPMPFADHPFCDRLCHPETWTEIDFPEGLTGHIRILIPNSMKRIPLSQAENEYPETFKTIAHMLISGLGLLGKKDG